MKPLKITAYLLDGRVAGSDYNFPLDSILQYQYFAIYRPDLIYCGSPPDENLEHAPLPFERRGKEPQWYWACSFNQEVPQGEYIKHWHKRFDVKEGEEYIDFKGKSQKVNLTAGKYKAYRMPMNIYLLDKLTWYAYGNMEEIKDLCETVTAIGKKKSQGFGYIDSWQFEEWHSDWSEVGLNGKVMRPIPVNSSDNLPDKFTLIQCGYRPPYWHRESKGWCYVS